MTIEQKFDMLGIDNAPGQEALQKSQALELRGEPLPGPAVDFSHGDVDAHIPTPGSFEVFERGVKEGAAQAYTPYRGRKLILEHVAKNLAAFTGAAIDPAKNLILTPGTQGALFLAMGSNMMPGDKVAIVEPDDTVEPGWVAGLLACAARYGGTAGVDVVKAPYWRVFPGADGGALREASSKIFRRQSPFASCPRMRSSSAAGTTR